MFIYGQFGIIQNLQMTPIAQTSFLVGTFFTLLYCKPALVGSNTACTIQLILTLLTPFSCINDGQAVRAWFCIKKKFLRVTCKLDLKKLYVMILQDKHRIEVKGG